MRLYAISWLVVLSFCGICLCDEDYLNDFRELCATLLVPALQNGPNPDNFKAIWDKYMKTAGEKIFESLNKNKTLEEAEDRCNKRIIESDIVCAFKDYATIGNLVEQDIRKRQETLGSSLKSAWYYYFLYIIAWLKHPRIARLDCDPPIERLWAFMAKLSHLESFDVLFDMKSVYNDVNSKGLRQEIDRVCTFSSTDKFCLIKMWTNTADKVDKLLAYIGRDKWDHDSSQTLKTAMRLHFYAVKSKFLNLHPSSSGQDFLSTEDSELKTWIEEMTFYIYSSLQNNQIESLVPVLELLPFSFDLPCDLSAEFPSLKRTICTFSGMIHSLQIYVKNVSVNVKHVSPAIDYEKFLQETRLEQILNTGETTLYTLTQVAQHLKLETKKSFGEVRTYFQRVAAFDFQKAQFDVAYIDDTVKKYKVESEQSSRRMDSLMKEILGAAMIAAIGDTAEAALKLSFKVAEACNPLNSLFGGGTAADLLDASQGLAQSFVGLAKADQLIGAFTSLISKVRDFVTKLSTNEKYLASVASLITNLKLFASSSSSSSASPSDFEAYTNKFLEDYNNYEPAVTKVDLRELTAYWENLVDRACDVLDSTSGLVASVTQLVLTTKGSCPKAKVEVQKLITTYEEIYDSQFALMDALADSMRGWTSYHAANMINFDFNAAALKAVDKPEIFEELHLLSAFSVICYKISIRIATESYCNLLEYLEGHRPHECVGAGTLISSLLSRTPVTCHTVEDYKVIPTKPSKPGDKAFINLKDLYAGKPVIFKIPDSQWLIDHDWILPFERHDMLFLQRFEIFLPVVSKRKKQVHINVEVTDGNQLITPDGTEYLISPPPKLQYRYKEGKKGRECGNAEDTNPYNDYCRGMPKICPVTKESRNCASRGNICPSVYAQLKIVLYGYEKANLAVPSTYIPLVARVRLCSHSTSNDGRRQQKGFNYETSKSLYPVEHMQNREDSDVEQDEKCCNLNKYYNEKEHKCTDCPSGTVSKYKGLFCGRNIRFVPAPTKEATFSFANANVACKMGRTKIASTRHIKKAVAAGDNSCRCGWLSDGTMAAPKPSDSCDENDGDSTITCDSNNTWGVYCLNNF